jgi:acetyl esterase/lipase
LEDCYAALRWLAAPDSGMGIDRGRIAVGGSSAGGNLAAAVTLMARDRGEVPLAFQLLVYPCLDDRHTTPSSHEMAAEGMIWSRAQSLRGWQLYLGNDRGNHGNDQNGEISPYAAPTRAANLDGLPPAYMMAAQLDLLRDEGIDYAMRLMQAGVPTELHVHPSAMHGFVLFAASAAVSERAISGYVTALRRALNP